MAWKSSWPIERREIDDGLFAFTNTNPKNGAMAHCYLLRRRRGGNVLFHGPDWVKFYEDDFFDSVGGFRHHVFTHAPELSSAVDSVVERFECTNWVSSDETGFIPGKYRDVRLSTIPSGRWLERVKPVPLAGHTPGFTGYRVTVGELAYLMIGDFFSRSKRGWRAQVSHPKLMPAGFRSIRTLESLEFDAFLPNKSFAGLPMPWPAENKSEMLIGARESLERKFKVKAEDY